MSQLVYAINVQNGTLVSFQGSSISFDFRQGVFDAKIYLVQPKQGFTQGQAQYQSFDPDAETYDGIRVGWWKDVSGTLADSDPNKLALTDQLGWTYNTTDEPDTPFWEGKINLLTQQMADWIGTGKSKKSFFAVNMVKGAELAPVLDQTGAENSTVYAATDDGGGAGVDMTEAIPIIQLPCKFKAANGHIYLIEENVTEDGIIFNRTV